MPSMTIRSLAALATLALTGAGVAQTDRPLELEIDATDLPRRLLEADLVIPVANDIAKSGGDLVLWYPKWVPGSHAPGGPIQNVGGMVITDPDSREIPWTRTPGEPHRITAHVPTGVDEITIRLRYITNQSSSNSHGLDSFGSELLGIISPNTVLMYPDGAQAPDTMIEVTLSLPDEWRAACALPINNQDGSEYTYDAVSLETLVDSPIMVGQYAQTYDLHESDAKDSDGRTVQIPPHVMSVFSEAESVIKIDETVLANYRAMVTEAMLMFGSAPFDHFDVLVATTNALDRNGLEHLRSTLNVIPQDRYQSPKNLKGWDRMLIPHEYVHAWCGKYRRPAGMATPDFHTPKDTELLWVYEGLTQYLGNVLEARSGMMDVDEFRWMMLNRLRSTRYQQGRHWRPLADTAIASHTLRAGSPSWGHLRRSQDYYYEGALIWMEADAIIRNETDGEKTLDDFSRVFFAHNAGDPIPSPYTRDDVVRMLNDTLPYDWDEFFAKRIERPLDRPVLAAASEIGYSIRYVSDPPEGPGNARIGRLDARDSLGISLSDSGVVRTVLLDSPADDAQIGPGMKLVGINGYVWSAARFADALEATPVEGGIDVMLVSGDRYVTRRIEYDGGPRYMTLVRDNDRTDQLAEIAKATRAE